MGHIELHILGMQRHEDSQKIIRDRNGNIIGTEGVDCEDPASVTQICLPAGVEAGKSFLKMKTNPAQEH